MAVDNCRAATNRGSVELTMQVLTKHGKGKTAISRRTTLVLAIGSFTFAAVRAGLSSCA